MLQVGNNLWRVCVDIVNISHNFKFAKNAIITYIKVELEKPEKCPLNIY